VNEQSGMADAPFEAAGERMRRATQTLRASAFRAFSAATAGMLQGCERSIGSGRKKDNFALDRSTFSSIGGSE
jgi:hypothetical protein